MEIDLATPEDTKRLGILLGRIARPGDVIALEGDLGAGKTFLTQAIGQGLEVPETCRITSPTFSLIHEYPGRLPLFHIDLYRLADEDEMVALGLDDYLYDEGVTVIEWAGRLGRLLPEERLELFLLIAGPESRKVRIKAVGASWRERVGKLRLV